MGARAVGARAVGARAVVITVAKEEGARVVVAWEGKVKMAEGRKGETRGLSEGNEA